MSKYYHGSESKIENFVDDFVGGSEAIDQAGPGIYFTKSLEQAQAYGPHIHIVELSPRGVISDEEGTSADRDDIVTLMKQAPEWEDTAYNFSEDPESGVEISADMALQYNDNQHDQFSQVWIDWYRYSPVEFVRNLVKLGYDMADINFKAGDGSLIKNAIVYNPSIIKLVDYKLNKVEESINEMEYPLADPPMYSDSNYKDKGGKIFYVKPEEFLKLAPKLEMDEETQENIEDLMGMMSDGQEIDPPVLYIEDGVVANHDGRHRAYAAINLGMKKIPVLVLDNDFKPVDKFDFKPQVKKTIREIIKEEIEEMLSDKLVMRTPVIKRPLYKFFDPKVDTAEELDEDEEKGTDRSVEVLSFFDFDGTLAGTMEPEEGVLAYKKITGEDFPHKGYAGWWDNKESLEPFDIKINEPVKKEYSKKLLEPNSKVILLTNRKGNLHNQIKGILDKNGIKFDAYDYKGNGNEKPDRIKSYLMKYPEVKVVNVYDDRPEQLSMFHKMKKELMGSDIVVNVFKVGKKK